MHRNYVNIIVIISIIIGTISAYRLPLAALSRILGYHHDEPDEDTLGDLPGNGELFEGDMIMDNRLRDAVLNKKRTAIDNTDMLWKNGVIYYVN